MFASTFVALPVFSISLLTCVLRVTLGDSLYIALFETFLQLFAIQWFGSSWITFLVTTTIFLVLARHEALAEEREKFPGGSNTVAASHDENTLDASSVCPIIGGNVPKGSPSSCPSRHYHGRGVHTDFSVTLPVQYPKHLSELHGAPLMYQCDLSHRRFSPFKDYFRHSYLYIGIPVGLSGSYPPLLRVDDVHEPNKPTLWNKSWFSIRPQDQAFRGGVNSSLRGKLDEFLRSEGEDPNEWPYAYFVTSPRCNGTANNPMAFWYLYTSEKKLTAAITQLDTSYGERRMWFMRNKLTSKPNNSLYAFRGKWVKDLHVSPFMPTSECTYAFESYDPCESGQENLEVLLTYNAEGRTRLITRVTSVAPSLALSKATVPERISFLCRWWYIPVSSFVVWRILSQALKIYLFKKPNTWSRPEPPKTSIGQPAGTLEKILERYFSLILSDTVENQSEITSVEYCSPCEHVPRVQIISQKQPAPPSPKSLSTPPPTPTIGSTSTSTSTSIQIISPSFYTRFFCYESPTAAFSRELLEDKKTCMADSSDRDAFVKLFAHGDEPDRRSVTPRKQLGWRWNLIFLLRSAPPPTAYSKTVAYNEFQGPSAMDDWVLRSCTADQIREYRRTLLRTYAGNWFGGFHLGVVSGDFNLFGLSREGALRMHEAWVKAGILTLSAKVVQMGVGMQDRSMWMGLAEITVVLLNLWACGKALY